MIVAGDYVTVHMVFTGHFAGTFGQTQGKGQLINFIATDLLKVTDEGITDNWHIEDNLTLIHVGELNSSRKDTATSTRMGTLSQSCSYHHWLPPHERCPAWRQADLYESLYG